MNTKVRVGLIYGGKSGEHEVSLQTALAVMKAFDFEKYEVQPFYITKQGEWRSGGLLTEPAGSKEQLMLAHPQERDDAGTGNALMPLFSGQSGRQNQLRISSIPERERSGMTIDVAFPLLHGTFGEDGTIQGLFEMAGIPYVGAGVLSSAVGMDKVVMKKLFAQEGLPQCVYRYFTRRQWDLEREFHILEVETALGYPCFVKPANLGSSVGISKAVNREALIEAVEEAFKFDRKVIVEEFVDAREIEMGVLGNEDPRASVPGEILSSNEFYDYKAKYVDGKSVMRIPADLDEETAKEIRAMAIKAYQALEGSGLARADFFIRNGDGQVLINEINTMPGFTPYSMYPLLWKESGVNYRELLDELIRLAIERFKQKQGIQYGIELE